MEFSTSYNVRHQQEGQTQAPRPEQPPQIQRNTSNDSTSSVLKSPRTPRFAEATSINSPIEPPTGAAAAFDNAPSRTSHYQPQAQPSDVGFGYIGHNSVQMGPGVEMPATPRSPLKSALKSPGAAPKEPGTAMTATFKESMFSPTWREEKALEKEEKLTEKRQAKDLKVKVRVRMAKLLLRGTNFSCSLIVLSMLATTFSIFNETKSIPPRNNLPPWAVGTNPWPQILLLCISCVSLFGSIVVFWAYMRRGHHRAQKIATYYTLFAISYFIFSIVMWGIGAGVLQNAKNTSNGQDIWGWSCKDNTRKLIFQQEVSYSLICRLQNWSLVCCIIEVVVETITIIIYGVVFYRFYSKRKLTKSMALRDKARSELYQAQSRAGTMPNTPAIPDAPKSARDGGYNPVYSPRFAPGELENVDEEQGEAPGGRYAAKGETKPFTLQAAPSGKTPKLRQGGGFEGPSPPQSVTNFSRPQTPGQGQQQQPMSPATPHQEAAPGERLYDAVPIPGAYGSTAYQK